MDPPSCVCEDSLSKPLQLIPEVIGFGGTNSYERSYFSNAVLDKWIASEGVAATTAASSKNTKQDGSFHLLLSNLASAGNGWVRRLLKDLL